MGRTELTDIRVLKWRSEAVGIRIGQSLLLASLLWFETYQPLVLIWLAAVLCLTFVDAALARRALRNPDHRGWGLASYGFRVGNSAVFASFILICLLDRAGIGIAAAMMCGCAIILNNAIMTRGSKLDAIGFVLPSSIMLMSVPMLAPLAGYPMNWLNAGILCLGSLAYVAFIVILARTLVREAGTLKGALMALERQRDEARLSRQEVAAERARWRTMFNHSPLPQVCFDASRLYAAAFGPGADATAAAQRMTGLFASVSEALELVALTEANESAHALYGVERFEGRIPDIHFHESFLTGFIQSLPGLTKEGVFPPFAAELVRSDGRVVEIEVHIRTLPDEERPWSLCMATYVDMTETRAAERAQAEARRAAEAASKAKSDFLAIMSHEIRTPLNGVLGMAQAMARHPMSAPQRGRLDVIRKSGEALLAILNDVLDLSKIEAGKLDLEVAPFDLEELARGAHAAFTGSANSKGLSFGLSIAPAARGRYLGDSARIRQILYNLISNAVKFTAQGEVRVTIARSEDGVRLVVSDTGIGIPPDRLGKLFQKFVQVDSSTTRQFGGTGLGLAICKELCTAMGGEICVESVLGEGASFTVDLPLPAVEAGMGADLTVVEDESEEGLGALRVLAAEDNEINQLVLSTLLAQFGITPTIVADGQAAVEAFTCGRWDVVLMDIQMPRLDGPAAARLIRQHEAASGAARTPIIALTANAMTHQTESYLEAGMDDVVAKPIQVGDLMRALVRAASIGQEAAPELRAAS